MIGLADVFLRTSAVLIAGLALATALSRRSAAVRHAVLAVSLLSAVLVVPASSVLPSWTIVLPAGAPPKAAPPRPVTAAAAHIHISVPEPAGPRPRAYPIAAIVWGCGFAAGLIVLAAGTIRLTRLSGRGTPVSDPRWIASARAVADSYGLRRPVALLRTDVPFMIATWGFRPARILLPPGERHWTDARIGAVLRHELAHVARADWIVLMAAHVLLAALWFNPLAWLVSRGLRRECERACDDAVLGGGVGAADYAGHLVALARECRRPSLSSWAWMPPALPMARPSGFERRIAAMLNPRLDRSPLSPRAALVLGAIVMAATGATAAARAVQAPPSALTGTVYDTTGGVLPGVTMALEDEGQATTHVTTDASGRFTFPSIGRGRYVLSAALPGFRSMRDQFDLNAAADWDRAVTLQVGDLKETITVKVTRIPATARAATAPSAPIRLRVGGNVQAPRKTLDVKPVYPESMRAAGREGQVSIEAVIAADGTVSYVRVLSAQVHPDFAIAAVDAVRQWQFTPTLLNGQAVEVVMTVSVQFSLTN